ncbi:MAG: CalY family protein [Clostridiales bacterium]|nr:CalY family protein [Clostridiales bacterium]
MKKKIIALCLVVALAATAVIGGTLAYFTDTDEATNTFTMGNVKIALQEKFDKDNAVLRPGTQKQNAIQKEVTIKNTGSEDAYVWYEFYIPTDLDSTDGSTGTNNIVHVNSAGRTWDTYRENNKYWAEGQTEALPLAQTWDHDPEVELGITGTEGYIRQETINGIKYNVYLALYHGKLAKDEVTSVGMTQVYLDSKVDNAVDENGNVYYTINGKPLTYDLTQGVNIIVKAYGIQAAGFDSVYAAYSAYQAQAKA